MPGTEVAARLASGQELSGRGPALRTSLRSPHRPAALVLRPAIFTSGAVTTEPPPSRSAYCGRMPTEFGHPQ